MTVGVVVPAAGSGTRLGPGAPKALRQLAGEPLLLHAVRRLRDCPSVGPVVVAAPAAEVAVVERLLEGLEVTVVAGGAERQDSVRLGLAALPAEADLVLVHDAARALVPVAVVEAVVAALRAGATAVVPVVPVSDTVKRVAGDVVLETLPRGELRAVQTPQGFPLAALRDAIERAGDGLAGATDCASLVETAGGRVICVDGDTENLKVTSMSDLARAEEIAARRRARPERG